MNLQLFEKFKTNPNQDTNPKLIPALMLSVLQLITITFSGLCICFLKEHLQPFVITMKNL